MPDPRPAIPSPVGSTFRDLIDEQGLEEFSPKQAAAAVTKVAKKIKNLPKEYPELTTAGMGLLANLTYTPYPQGPKRESLQAFLNEYSGLQSAKDLIYPGLCAKDPATFLDPSPYFLTKGVRLVAQSEEEIWIPDHAFNVEYQGGDKEAEILSISKKICLPPDKAIWVIIYCNHGSPKSGLWSMESHLLSTNWTEVRDIPGFDGFQMKKTLIGEVKDLPLPDPYYPPESSRLGKIPYDINAPLYEFRDELKRVWLWARQKYTEDRNLELGDLAEAAEEVKHLLASLGEGTVSGDLKGLMRELGVHLSDAEFPVKNMFVLKNKEWGTYGFGAEVLEPANDEFISMIFAADIQEEDDSYCTFSVGNSGHGGYRWISSHRIPLSSAYRDIPKEIYRWVKLNRQKILGQPHTYRDRWGTATFRFESIVLHEATQEKTIEVFKDKLEKAGDIDPQIYKDYDGKVDVALVVAEAFTLDPTKNGTYVPWILTTYLRGLHSTAWGWKYIAHSRYEDINNALRNYDALKKRNKLPDEYKDINQIKSFGELIDLSEEWQIIGDAASKQVFKKGNIRVIQPLNREAAILYAQDPQRYNGRTEWCTGNPRDDAFASYREGNLYIFFHGEKPSYQAYVVRKGEIAEFKDAEDDSMDPDDYAGESPEQAQAMRAIGYESPYSMTDEKVAKLLGAAFHAEPKTWAQRLQVMAKPPFSKEFVEWLREREVLGISMLKELLHSYGDSV